MLSELPPSYNLEAEQSILGSILVNPDNILSVSDVINPEDLYKISHFKIYSEMLTLYQSGQEVNLLSISEVLRHKGGLEDIGGVSYLANIMRDTYSVGATVQHAKIVKAAAIKRRIHNWLIESSVSFQDGVEDLREYLGHLELGIIGISDYVKERKSPQVEKILDEINNDLAKTESDKKTCVPCDSKFYQMIPGYYPSHLWMVGGYTSSGKSTLLAQMLTDACREGAKTLIFSLEENRKIKLIKFLANIANVSQRKILTGDIRHHTYEIGEAEREVKSWQLSIYDDVRTLEEMRLKAKKHKLKEGLDIVAIDYVQNIKGDGGIYERMSKASQDLFSMANDLDLTVIALSQISNESVKDDGGVIALKGAGELAAAADIVLWITRNKKEPRDMDCAVRKNRPFGETGNIPLQFNENYTRLERRFM